MKEEMLNFPERHKRLPLFDIPVLKCDISPESAETMAELLEAEAVGGNKTVDFVISSRGGNLDEAFILTQDMQRIRDTYNVKFRAIAKGYADSAATLVFAAADIRVAYSDTEFLIHEPRIETEEPGEQTLTEARYEVFVTRKLQRRAHKLLAHAMGKSVQEIREIEKIGKPMTAQQAAELGLVHEIRVFGT